MVILNRRWTEYLRLGWLLNWGLLSIVAVGIVSLIYKETAWHGISQVRLSFPADYDLQYDKIGWGPLALNGMRTLGPVPELAQQLILIGYDQRPDASNCPNLRLKLKDSGEEIDVRLGDRIYVQTTENGKFGFSLHSTPIVLNTKAIDKDALIVEVSTQDRQGNIVLRNTLGAASILDHTYFQLMQASKVCGPDLFLQQFGGVEYQALSQKLKLQVDGETFFVQKGCLLEWQEGSWKLVETINTVNRTPLARVETVDQRGMQIKIWDATGMYVNKVALEIQPEPKHAYKPEDIISKLRPRSTTELSCLLGKRRVVVKEGDWWVKTEFGWKNLATVRDLDLFIQHKLQGELFIFDCVECNKHNINVKVRYFDAMRTQMQFFTLSVPSDKTTSMIARKQAMHGSTMIAKNSGRPQLQVPQYQSENNQRESE